MAATLDRILVHVDTEHAHQNLVNSRLAYVSASRARIDAQIYTNDAGALGRSLSHETSKSACPTDEHVEHSSLHPRGPAHLTPRRNVTTLRVLGAEPSR